MKRSDFARLIYAASITPVPYHDNGCIQLQWRVENIVKAIEEAFEWSEEDWEPETPIDPNRIMNPRGER